LIFTCVTLSFFGEDKFATSNVAINLLVGLIGGIAAVRCVGASIAQSFGEFQRKQCELPVLGARDRQLVGGIGEEQ